MLSNYSDLGSTGDDKKIQNDQQLIKQGRGEIYHTPHSEKMIEIKKDLLESQHQLFSSVKNIKLLSPGKNLKKPTSDRLAIMSRKRRKGKKSKKKF
mmetsp:Transcript_19397/g.17201  ORF Transcript_19397/g.17201 Transcript_19397/m.17201 type:complete len:96 (+) Transcript_19397:68-355(+)